MLSGFTRAQSLKSEKAALTALAVRNMTSANRTNSGTGMTHRLL